MSDSDVPAGQAGGLTNVSEVAQLPARLRVHALAKLISVTSRRVLDTLVELGSPARGAQSSIDRDIAQRVVEALQPEGAVTEGEPAGPAHDDSAAGTAPVSDTAPAHRVAAEPEAGPEPSGALPLFAAPSPMFLPPAPPPARPATPPSAAAPAESTEDDDDSDDSDDGSGDGGETKRRRRRGRRGRGRGKGSDEDTSDSADDGENGDFGDTPDGAEDSAGGRNQSEANSDAEQDDDEADEADDSSEESGGSSRRRRRRRRRKDPDADSADSDKPGDGEADPPNTVTRVRESRTKDSGDAGDNQGIQGVRGSTRLEAKRQRRRDGRDAGRRRAPVLSESEFLARRESVQRTMVVRQSGERSEIGVLEDGVLVEHFVTSSGGSSLVGNVYLGRVQNVLPSMEAAFVDIGRGRNAVLYAGEVDWDAAGLAGKARRIEQALSSGDGILVQVTKDPIGHKGARLTTQISLPGRFLVYVPSGGTHGISRKLADTERRRLKDLLKEIVPDDAGVIIRTASEGVSQEALERDVRRLQAQWDVVKAKSDSVVSGKGKAKSPELLYEEPDLMIKVVRDQFNEDFANLVVSGDDAWDTLHAYVGHVAPELTERLHRHVGTGDVFVDYRIDEQLAKALDRKVWLPSGGTLVIDRTEAMTVIDVNTGKFTGSGGNLEETVTRNNLEAAEEIVRQLRLRDIGGIIVVDFIDMVLESNRDLVLRRLTECLGRDRTRHQVAEVTSLGLVQMTRKRVGVGLLEAFSTPCEHCRGRGVVVSSNPVEPRGDGGQHNSGGGSGRRRGRVGGDQGNDQQGSSGQGSSGQHGGGQGSAGQGGAGQGGGQQGSGQQGGGQQGGGQHNGGNNNGRRRGGGSPSEVAAAREHPPATEDHASPNGRPGPGPAPKPHSEPASSTRSVTPLDPGSSSAPDVASTVREAAPEAAAVPEAAPDAVPESPVDPVPTSDVADTAPSGQPVPNAGVASPNGAGAEPADSRRTDTDLAIPGDESPQQPEPVTVGASSGESARPARRRRRSASRPAGPPSAGAEGGGTADPI
jgi:ribonuclease E